MGAIGLKLCCLFMQYRSPGSNHMLNNTLHQTVPLRYQRRRWRPAAIVEKGSVCNFGLLSATSVTVVVSNCYVSLECMPCVPALRSEMQLME